jgi:hypothetical protein
MRSMNSIIFEGIIRTGYSLDGEEGHRRVTFVMCSRHTMVRAGEDDLIVLDDEIRVEFRSKELIEAAIKNVRVGREVKVVGSIHRSKIDQDVYILAEHAEFRPVFAKADVEERWHQT